jgi:hypothetical protein
MTMNHTKAALRALLIVSAAMSLLAAEPALARRGKGGMPPGVQLKPEAQPAVDQAPVRPDRIKPILHPRRHGSKPRGGAR